jgi:hypothetical protein
VEEQDGAARANESRIYLDGRFVAMARKHKAFEAKDLVPGKTLIEDLGAGQTTIMVLSGARTRLAVAICADLQEATIPGLLVAAGVNFLLVPAMTKKIGAFNASVGQVTGYCQGVAVVANTRWGDDGKPFLCLCGVPREEAAKQVGEFAGDGEVPAPTLGLLDPNLPLPDAVTWWRPDARSD